jgi:uncharacterized membrane protein YphA (DoxX/SURF4 family)
MVHPPGQKSVGGKGQAASLTIVRICVGMFIFFFGFDKASWLLDSTPLLTQLSSWLTDAPPISRWYLERMMPGAPVFARLLPSGLMLGGFALVLGFWTRMAAALALLMVLSLQLAAGSMFRYQYLSDPGGLPVVGALVALIVGAGKLPLSLRN